MTDQTTLAQLDNAVFFADMTDAIVRGTGEALMADPDALVVRQESGTHMIWAADAGAARRILDRLGPKPTGTHVVSHDEHTRQLIEERWGFDGCTTCFSVAYPATTMAPDTRVDFRVEPLGEEWLDTLAEHYHLDGPGYIMNRLKAGVMLGAFRDDTLLGFIGQHMEGAMGLLEVLPEHRRLGVGQYLLTHLTRQLLAEGRLPYDHIIVGNAPSEALHRKLGFDISTRHLHWQFRRGWDL